MAKECRKKQFHGELCHWASSGYTLLCIRFHLCSFVLCSAVSVHCLRQWDPRTHEDCLALGLEEKAYIDICLIYRLVGYVSCAFESQAHIQIRF